jgi:hypothetical protein
MVTRTYIPTSTASSQEETLEKSSVLLHNFFLEYTGELHIFILREKVLLHNDNTTPSTISQHDAPTSDVSR